MLKIAQNPKHKRRDLTIQVPSFMKVSKNTLFDRYRVLLEGTSRLLEGLKTLVASRTALGEHVGGPHVY